METASAGRYKIPDRRNSASGSLLPPEIKNPPMAGLFFGFDFGDVT
jgi:hypothetical protein